MAPQKHDALEGVTRATSPEIQETGEGSGTALPWGVGGDDDRVLDLAHVPWAAAFKACDNADEDEESAVRHTLEHGLTWACHAFDELIPPMTSVRLLYTMACL
jgi:hypothetical protein